MFEDSTFESTGRIHTRSKRWMIVTFVINGSILLGLILIPLVFPDALHRHALPFLVVAPETPTPKQLPPAHHPAESFMTLRNFRLAMSSHLPGFRQR